MILYVYQVMKECLFEMEKVLSAMPEGNPYGMKSDSYFEINPNHQFLKLYKMSMKMIKMELKNMQNYYIIRHC